MSLGALIMGLVIFGILVWGVLASSRNRERAQQELEEEFKEGIGSWIGREKMKKEEPEAQEGTILKAKKPVNMAGVVQALILGAIVVCMLIYIWTPSQVREYRVQLDNGIYE